MTKQYSNFAIWLTHPSGRKQCVWEKLVEGDTLLDKDMDRYIDIYIDVDIDIDKDRDRDREKSIQICETVCV